MRNIQKQLKPDDSIRVLKSFSFSSRNNTCTIQNGGFRHTSDIKHDCLERLSTRTCRRDVKLNASDWMNAYLIADSFPYCFARTLALAFYSSSGILFASCSLFFILIYAFAKWTGLHVAWVNNINFSRISFFFLQNASCILILKSFRFKIVEMIFSIFKTNI